MHLRVFSATFRNLDGAIAALCQLGDARSQGLIDLENAAALTLARSGHIAFLPADALPDLPAWPGYGRGAYILGMVSLCFVTGDHDAADRAVTSWTLTASRPLWRRPFAVLAGRTPLSDVQALLRSQALTALTALVAWLALAHWRFGERKEDSSATLTGATR